MKNIKLFVIIIFLFLVFSCFTFTSYVKADDSWYDTNWGYRKKITVDSSQVVSSFTNFPVCIDIVDSDVKAHAQLDGDDIIFTNIAGDTVFNHEVEKYDNADGSLTAWVNISNLVSTVDTEIYMYYGNPGCDSQQSITDTWNSTCYELVQHFNGSTDTDCLDSTVNNHDMTGDGGNPDYETTGVGLRGYGVKCDGVGDYLLTPDSDGFNIASGYVSVRFKLNHKYDSTNVTNDRIINQIPSSTHDGDWGIHFLANNGRMRIMLKDSSTWKILYTSKTSWLPDIWYNLMFEFGSNGMRLWLNGTLEADVDASTADMNPDGNLEFGGDVIGDTSYFNGVFDEVHIIKTHIGSVSDYPVTWYNNINNATDGGFFSLGSEEAYTPPPPPTDYIFITNLYPVNHSTGIHLQPFVYATFRHLNGSLMTIRWYNDSCLIDTKSNVGNGTYYQGFINATERNTLYNLTIHVNDTWGFWCNRSYNFTTLSSSSTGVIVAGYPRSNIGVVGVAGIIGLIGFLFINRKKKKEFS